MTARVVQLIAALAVLLITVSAEAATNASLDGIVVDPSGGIVPNAELTLTSLNTRVERKLTTGADGTFAFQNLPPGDYAITAEAAGFRVLERTGMYLGPNQKVRLDLQLEVGDVTETVTVTAGVTPINFENATQETGVGPQVLNQLPLLVSGAPRDLTSFARLVPGVNFAGAGNTAFDARVNGGMQGGDEAVVDGATMTGIGGNTGFINFFDIRHSPDEVGEFKMITGNYEPHLGASSSAQIVVTTKSGTSEYHGGLFEYHRNTVLNARQFGAVERSHDIENDFGGFIGGPIPGLSRGNFKAFGYFLYEGFRIRGGVTRPTLSIPSLKQRQGDFTDWVDGSGNLIPVFDPGTTRSDGQGGIIREQFNCMGVANVICPSRISNSLANQWFQHLPQPTSGGALNNFVPPVATAFGQFGANNRLYKGDIYANDSNHIAITVKDNDQPADEVTFLPPIISNEQPNEQFKDVIRVNWSKTFSPTLLNNFTFGWTHANFRGLGLFGNFAGDLPQIAGVQDHAKPPEISFSDGFEQFGNGGAAPGTDNTNGTFVWNNLTTVVRGKHTFKFGGEYWFIRKNPPIFGPTSGEFSFERGTTGLLNVNSGNPIASFLLERVSGATGFFTAIDSTLRERDAYIGHFGDTWKATRRLTVNIGVRWDMHRPAWEADGNNSFFDPLRPNPGAGGRLGALAFGGDGFGAASFGSRYPEDLFKKGFAPRLGIAYALNDSTVIRAGYGIYYGQAVNGGWGDGIVQEGFSTTASFSATQGGLEPSMILSEEFPQNFTRPPFIDPSFRNGQSILYRAIDGNRLPYSQQWNLTIERQFSSDTSLSLAYVANKGNRLNTAVAPVNVLNPSLLSMGPQLRDQFQPGQAELHGVPVPYDGWAEQLACAPSVAQALLPFPQFCDRLAAINENAGVSTYHSFQLRLQKNFAEGAYLLTSYTFSKMITNGGSFKTASGGVWSGQNGSFSPFERHREKGLANDDVPHNLTVAWVYELPFGPGKQHRSGSKVINTLAGGWTVSGIYRAVSGVPFFIRSGQCNVPGEFRVRCVPALLDESRAFLQDKGNYDPGRGPLLNASAFEPLSSFQQFGYYGAGPRMLNIRQFGLQNWDISIYKNTRISESVNLQLRAEFFNIFNMHYFAGSAVWGGSPIITNLSNPSFGGWNGSVSPPRNIQLGVRLEF